MSSSNYVFKQTKPLMGTFVTITFEHNDQLEAREIGKRAFAEMQRVIDIVNYFDEKSEIGFLNQHGHIDQTSPETLDIICKSINFSRLTGGAFDITVLPLVNLWKENTQNQVIPANSEISRALKLVDYNNVLISEGKISFVKPGMGIALGAVAKGYVVDKALEFITCAGVERALVNAGGDIRVTGGTRERPQKIGVRDPINRKRIITILKLCNEAVASSGTYQRGYKDLIDPRSGQAVDEIISATVVANRTIDADILATTIYVLGVENGLDLINSLSNVGAIIISKDRRIFESGIRRNW